MGKHTGKTRIATRDTFQHTGGQYLYKHGPQLEDDLFKAMGDTVRPNGRDELIQRGVRAGWFVIVDGGRIDCSDFARAHYDKEAGVVKEVHVGLEAAQRDRFGALNRPPLRREYLINSRGSRQDIPEWSIRIGRSFQTKG